MDKVLNPLYAGRTTAKAEKQVVTARIENTQPGVCPKCHTKMVTSALGQSMGNQTVFFCNQCRVCEPIPAQ